MTTKSEEHFQYSALLADYHAKSQRAPAPGEAKPSRAGALDYDSLCKELMELADIISCTIIGYHGRILAEELGDLRPDEDLGSREGSIAAVIWGGLKKVEEAAGRIRFVSATYEKFTIVGIPFDDFKIAILVVVKVGADTAAIADILTNFVEYWHAEH